MKSRRVLPANRQLALLKDTFARWENTHYFAVVDYEIGEVIDDAQLMELAKKRMRNAVIAMDLLEEKIKKLRPSEVPDEESTD